MMTNLQFAEFKPVGRKAVLLLNRPPLNIINQAMCEELTAFLKDFPLADYDGLLITTNLQHFSAGADIGEHFPEKVREMLPKFDELLLTLVDFPLPTAAAITGSCLGGGLELAIACCKVIAWKPETVVMGSPEIKLACFPPFGLAVLPKLARMSKSTISFLLTGEIIKGEKGHSPILILPRLVLLGLADETFSGTPEELIEGLDFTDQFFPPSPKERFPNGSYYEPFLFDEEDIQQELAGKEEIINVLSHHALKCAINVLIYCSHATDLRTALAYAEHIYLTMLTNHPDYLEGLTAYQQKRTPVYIKTGL